MKLSTRDLTKTRLIKSPLFKLEPNRIVSDSGWYAGITSLYNTFSKYYNGLIFTSYKILQKLLIVGGDKQFFLPYKLIIGDYYNIML